MEWPEQIGERFGLWLNAQLRNKLPAVSHIESCEWRRRLLDEGSTWTQYLRDLRKRLDVPPIEQERI